jgi:hypothetical protein
LPGNCRNIADLGPIRIKIRSTLLLAFKLRAQVQFVGFRFLQQGPIVVPDDEIPAERGDHGEA